MSERRLDCTHCGGPLRWVTPGYEPGHQQCIRCGLRHFYDAYDPAGKYPGTTLAYQNSLTCHTLKSELVQLRHSKGLDESDIADRLGIPFEEVKLVEAESSNPTLLTLHSYASAVGAKITFTIEPERGLVTVPEAAIKAAAQAMVDDWNPDRDPVLTAMFSDYSATSLAAATPHLREETVDRLKNFRNDYNDYQHTSAIPGDPYVDGYLTACNEIIALLEGDGE